MRRWSGPVLLIIAAPAAAQQSAPDPSPQAATSPAYAAPVDDAASAANTVMLFGQDESRMTVPVSIAGTSPQKFVVDTGAQRTVISRELAAVLRLQPGRIVRVTGMTGSDSVATVIIPALRVGTIDTPAIEAPAIAAQNLGALGLLGIDTLQGRAVGIDFDTRTMTVTPARRRNRRERTERGEIVVRARSLFGQLVVTDAYCNGVRIRVIIDTGSSVSMGNAALRRKLLRKPVRSQSIALTGVTGQTVMAHYSTIDRVMIGSLTITSLPIALTAVDAPPFRQFGLAERPAILLGMDALTLFRRVDIDFANREVRLALPRNVTQR
ncbi:aspartyl protease family protein [Sphingomonas sp. CFBP9019]|uniref:aspartyl protease family protein n=2 Tax=unclassified Sphingomonas TaxID=196159 RepID=UPI0005A65EC4|nr:aspartyl protease family protein [Sphingomonas sp. CFBP9019]MDY1009189.1 retroviral-like aspartic protease family protein [Sphingomonas sp. CFBP9019]